MILEPSAEAEAVITRGIDIHRTVVASIAHRLVILQTVGNERHQAVVAGGDDQRWRREMTAHGVHRREIADKLRILQPLFTQEVQARPLVRHLRHHRYDRIEEYREVGSHVEGSMGRDDRRQMATSREAHDSHIVGIDAPHLSRVADDTDALHHVAHRFRTIALRQTVVHHEIGNTLLVHPLGGKRALMGVRQHGIAAARYADNSLARRRFWQEAHHLSLTVGSKVECKCSRCLCLSGYTQQQQTK